MQIKKILNNNVVQALDNNVEYIVMGKGLGFQKKVGDLVDKEKIEKTFVLENTEAVEEWSRVYVNLPDGEMQVFLNILTFAEAASVALHFVNAQKDAGLHEKDRQMTQIVVGISDIVRLHFGCDLEEDSFSYNRFITHLRYLAQRIVSGVSGGKNDAFLYEQVRVNYPESFICTQKIANYIKTGYTFELSLDEQVYLTIHIQRLKDSLDK